MLQGSHTRAEQRGLPVVMCVTMALTRRADRPAAAGARVVVTAQLETAREFCRPTSTSWEPGLKPYLHSSTPEAQPSTLTLAKEGIRQLQAL